jgi:hypothetical protein
MTQCICFQILPRSTGNQFWPTTHGGSGLRSLMGPPGSSSLPSPSQTPSLSLSLSLSLSSLMGSPALPLCFLSVSRLVSLYFGWEKEGKQEEEGRRGLGNIKRKGGKEKGGDSSLSLSLTNMSEKKKGNKKRKGRKKRRRGVG